MTLPKVSETKITWKQRIAHLEAEERAYQAEIKVNKAMARIPVQQPIEKIPVDFVSESRTIEGRKVAIYQTLIAGYRVNEVALQFNTTASEIEAVQDEMADRTMKVTQGSMKTAAALDLDRLESLLRTLWINAMAGDLPSIDRCLKVLERRSKMIGLDTPTALQLNTVTDQDLAGLTLEELQTMRKLQAKAAGKK